MKDLPTGVTDREKYLGDLSDCDKEPIHIPGLIQPYGVLIVARREDMRVMYASVNTESATGRPVGSILGKPLVDCLGPAVYEKIVYRNEAGQVIAKPLRSICLSSNNGQRQYFTVRHLKDLVYVEIEPEVEDSEAAHLPIQARTAIDAVRSVSSLKELLSAAAYELRSLTGYDRVMVYRFDKDWHGHVVAEDLVDDLEPYLDLHFPESDIPSQARRLYTLQRIRVLADANCRPVPVLSDLEMACGGTDPIQLDMTFCGLRSVSPVHMEYVRNMKVGATLTLSLLTDDRLWGLLVCHHRESRLPSPALRSSCDLISQIISFLIRQYIEQEASCDRSRKELAITEIAASLNLFGSVTDGLVAAEEQVLSLVGAGGALLSFGGKIACIGETPPLDDAVELKARLRELDNGKVFAHDSLPTLMADFGQLRQTACGILHMSILRSPGEGILWCRPEVETVMKWGGNPDKPSGFNTETGRISPRKSFETWKTCVALHSLPWQDLDLEMVRNLKRTISTHLLTLAERAFDRSRAPSSSLIQLPNRRHFQEKLRVWAERKDLHPAAVILINLDRFKLVNEAFGRSVGDDLILQVSGRLSEFAKADVLIAGLGGDEFGALCMGMTAPAVEETAQSIRSALSIPFQVIGHAFYMTASLGVAHTSHGAEENLLDAADTAMHFAKRSGRNQSVAFDKLLQITAVNNLEMEQDLYRAIEKGEFKLVYQPIVDLPQAGLYGFEALIRWHHPVKGTIPPLDFIPIAEETGLIVPIGRWVLRESVKTIKCWTDLFHLPMKIHVNVSAPQLISTDFVNYVIDLLREFDFDSASLSIEVTESVLLREAAVESLRELRAHGIGVSLDDFGIGHSSLAYLQRLPVNLVKIDQRFVRDVAFDPKSREFLTALVKLIQTLDLELIAEGIETEEQNAAIQEAGCVRAQGYLFSKPADEPAVKEMLSAYSNTVLRTRGIQA
jgi:diguanylate cyclase (GGDEF)-like protein